jgi:spore germination protein KB
LEKAVISAKQLFVLVVLFEMGSAILVGYPTNLKQDAWIAILIGMVFGVMLFFVYYRLFLYYPDLPLTAYVQKIIGKFAGSALAFCYIIYFMYLAARVLRDFGELLTSTIYTETPIFFLNTLMLIVVVYAIQKGFEVMARVGELFFMVVYLMAIAGFSLIIFSGLIHLEFLKPMFESGLIMIVKTSLKSTVTFPFGEMIVFTMLLPYIKDQKKAKNACILGVILSGINFIIACIINISTLGIELFVRSPYPLLSTVSKINMANFIDRLDVLFMLYLMIAGFMKVAIFYYAAVIGTTDLFKLKNHQSINFPIGILILLASIMIATNYSEHIQEGLRVVPIYLHWPFQIIIPCFLLVIAFFRNRKKQQKTSSS